MRRTDHGVQRPRRRRRCVFRAPGSLLLERSLSSRANNHACCRTCGTIRAGAAPSRPRRRLAVRRCRWMCTSYEKHRSAGPPEPPAQKTKALQRGRRRPRPQRILCDPSLKYTRSPELVGLTANHRARAAGEGGVVQRGRAVDSRGKRRAAPRGKRRAVRRGTQQHERVNSAAHR